jgi:hypothetical protein
MTVFTTRCVQCEAPIRLNIPDDQQRIELAPILCGTCFDKTFPRAWYRRLWAWMRKAVAK